MVERARDGIRLRPGLRIGDHGTELVIVDPSDAVVHRLSGRAAAVVRDLSASDRSEVAPEDRVVLTELIRAGIVDGVGRRPLLVGVAAGIFTTALPSRLAAASDVSASGVYDDSSDGTDAPPDGTTAASGKAYRTFTTDGDFIVAGTGTLNVDVLVVGGGGGGGYAYAGGGGGGAVSILSLGLTAGTYPVVVGGGGAGGGTAAVNEGGDGGDSIFWAGSPGEYVTPGGRGGSPGPFSLGGGDSPGASVPLGSDGSSEQTGGGGDYVAGGGGAGAGGPGGSAADQDIPGAGGPGYLIDGFFAADLRVAGGGGGGSGPAEPGGAGTDGGGSGGRNAVGLPAAGIGAGGGGGGGDYSFNGRNGGAGSAGIVVVRYSTS